MKVSVLSSVVTAVLLNLLVMNYRPLFNGDAGVAVVPAPLTQGMFVGTSNSYQWIFAAGGIAAAAAVYWFVRRITESPYGRTLRAMRDNDKVADSLGKNLVVLRTGALVTGGAIAGLSGAILVSFIGVWSPSEWSYAETIVLFTAVIIGGAGNHTGAVLCTLLGALLVPVGFEEITRFISNANQNLPPNLLPSLQWVAIGLLITVFLWVRPQGVLPERKRAIALPDTGPARPAFAAIRHARAEADGAAHVAAHAGPDAQPRPQSAGTQLLEATAVSKAFGACARWPGRRSRWRRAC
jgi:ABC-type branched-subunit amino acid transport system permease subunit